MIAFEAMLPDDADEQREIQRLLRGQPDLQVMIERAQAKARKLFDRPSFTLDAPQFDDWDPPLQTSDRDCESGEGPVLGGAHSVRTVAGECLGVR